MKLSVMQWAVLICIVGYLVLKWMVRRVWFREEHLRPGYFRHSLILHTVDFAAILFLVAVFFLLLATHRWLLTFLAATLLISYDLALREFFLYLEARRMCVQQPRFTMRSAKRRLKDRKKRESPY